jgi:hypothetical protein
MPLPDEAKQNLEEAIDDWLLRFDEIAESEYEFLKRIGIEPTLESLMSYTAGILDSIVGGYIHSQCDRGMTEAEDAELIELLKGKIPEFKRKFKAFLSEE